MNRRTIVHLGAWDRNYGDRAIQFAMRQGYTDVARELGLALEFEYIAIAQTRKYDRSASDTADDTPALDDARIAAINATADMLLIGAGGLIMNRRTGPFQVQVAPEDWDRIEVPVVFQSIGWNQFPYRDSIDIDWLRDNVFEPLRSRRAPTLVAVRNRGTFERVQPLYPEVRLVADPALFARAEAVPLPGGPHIGLCWSSDRLHKRWPSAAAEARFLDGIAHACSAAVADLGATIWFMPHIQGLDDDIADTLSARIGRGFRNLEHERPDLYPASLAGAPEFIGYYRSMNAVLGMRKHSVMIPVGQGVPVLGLGDQDEVHWALDDLGIGDNVLRSNGDVQHAALAFMRDAVAGRVPLPAQRLSHAHRQVRAFIRDALALTPAAHG
jgi:hypothetical protein